MIYASLLQLVAQATYGSGAYGSEGYGTGTTTTTTTTTSGGTLANTGMPVVLIGTIGAALILVAVVLFIQSRKKKK